ncbi:MAG: FAD-binding protein, partial [Chloroflexi bacterium]|nr:FAD-binding protein [Chloroflexota bacterium]
MADEKRYDIVVAGAGNAALSAALSAAEQGASVLVLEKAPHYLRGGNTFFSGGLFRFAYEGIEDIREIIPEISDEEQASIDVGSYNQAKFYDDVMRVTEGQSDPEMVQ